MIIRYLYNAHENSLTHIEYVTVPLDSIVKYKDYAHVVKATSKLDGLVLLIVFKKGTPAMSIYIIKEDRWESIKAMVNIPTSYLDNINKAKTALLLVQGIR